MFITISKRIRAYHNEGLSKGLVYAEPQKHIMMCWSGGLLGGCFEFKNEGGLLRRCFEFENEILNGFQRIHFFQVGFTTSKHPTEKKTHLM